MANGVTPTSEVNPAPGSQFPRTQSAPVATPPVPRVAAQGAPSLPNLGASGVAQGISEAGRGIARGIERGQATKEQRRREREQRELQLTVQQRELDFKKERFTQDTENALVANGGKVMQLGLTDQKNLLSVMANNLLADPELTARPETAQALERIDSRMAELSLGIVEVSHGVARAIKDPTISIDDFHREYQAKMRTWLGADGSTTIPLERNGKIDSEALAAKASAIGNVSIFMLNSQTLAKHQATQGKAAAQGLAAKDKHKADRILMRQITGGMGGFNPDDPATIQQAVDRTALMLAEALADERSGFEGADPVQFLIRTIRKSGDLSAGTAADILEDLHDEYFTGGIRDMAAYEASGGDKMRVMPALQYLMSFVMPTLEAIRNKDAEVATFVSYDEEGNPTEHKIKPSDAIRRARLIVNESLLAQERVGRLNSGIPVAGTVLQATLSFDGELAAGETAEVLGAFGQASQEFSLAVGRHPTPVENAAIWHDVLQEFPDLLLTMDVLASHYGNLELPASTPQGTAVAGSSVSEAAPVPAVAPPSEGLPPPQPAIPGPVQPRGAPQGRRPFIFTGRENPQPRSLLTGNP